MLTGEFKKSFDVIRLVESGKILVNGKIVTNPEFHINKKDLIEMKDGQGLKTFKTKSFVYLILNKPTGYVSQKLPLSLEKKGVRYPKETNIENNNEKSVYELIYKIPELDIETKKTLFAVGRLDKDTEGLLIFTNDGKLSNELMRPEKHIQKTYFVETQKSISELDLKKLESGVKIRTEEGEAFVKAVKTQKFSDRTAELIIDEGKKRQVKLMFLSIGNNVVRLKRVGIGKLRIENLDFKGKNYLITNKQELEKLLF